MHVSSSLPGKLALATAILFFTLRCGAQTTVVRSPQGTTHGFLCLEDERGKTIGYGDILQTLHGARVTSRLTLHFSDGSLDDETTIFTQGRTFRFLSDHHVQQGAFFTKPLDLTLDASGDLTLRTRDAQGNEKLETSHLALPPDIANGMVPVLLLNTPPHTPETRFSMVIPYGKGRLIGLRITPDGTRNFTAGGVHRTAEVFLIHPEIGGIAGIVSPLLGKQPLDDRLWLAGGEAPQLLRMDAQLAEGGPVVSIRLAGLNFAASPSAINTADSQLSGRLR